LRDIAIRGCAGYRVCLGLFRLSHLEYCNYPELCLRIQPKGPAACPTDPVVDGERSTALKIAVQLWV
ncbi:MAG TPA: hypothetical protein VJB15_09235, partial [Rhodothermia bacterium]|nr:hypothetical protein [Rhodothermia bacterium]